MTLVRDVAAENWGNAAFAAFNAFVAAWAIVAYIGIWNTLVDIWIGLTDWLYVEVRPKAQAAVATDAGTLDWRAVLYHGDVEGSVPLSEYSNIDTVVTPVTEKQVAL